MIALRINGEAFDQILQLIDTMMFPDLMPLAEECREIMIEDNREGLLASTDSFGDPMTPLEESTIKTRRGNGPPLIPQGAGDPAISDYQVKILPTNDRILCIGHWPNTPWIHFHATGFTVTNNHGIKIPVVARDPVGIRPNGVEKIKQAAHDFASFVTYTTRT